MFSKRELFSFQKEDQIRDETFLQIQSPEDGRTWIHKLNDEIVTGKRNIWNEEKYHSMWTNKNETRI